ncbi:MULTISPECIES: oligosaccharide flippase family protein [Flavobacterium]|uniref:lipopolysaccharide biosynthesis protein n=1 Tax=Flavobacterium TaxID=237 RepID=UPI000869A816|nr:MULTISPECIES: oligosaccharide flippase family protein [Flavobacterium]MBN9283295.1 oligosaccharide flippase family protein [Flavobacterium sp.]ODS80224.1 MAG: polysaccharide biosynthesis protein [Chryseobacterium sp. SCN 40-13]OJV68027.1 MAG: polysaccharide biosynthesis protein [Flavobacterium sp. 40-81]
MGLYKNLFKQTFIYGVATVLPRMLSFLLVRLHTDLMPKSDYGNVTIVLSWMVFFNVILSYGMETAFFRFYNKEEDKKSVIETTTISLFWTSMLFLAMALLFRSTLAEWADVETQYVTYAVWILVLDALVVIPFSKLRAFQRPIKYAVIKICNVTINVGLNIFFLVFLPKIAKADPDGFISSFYVHDYQVGYIFIANLIASLATLLVFLPDYFRLKWHFNVPLWKNMMNYGLPILFAGLAFGINEHFDKILLGKLLPQNIAKAEVGAYSACYKLGLFMVLFRTAYTLGIEPFFFNHADKKDAPQTYAVVTKYFVIFGSMILLCVVVFADILKVILVPNSTYWEAMKVVPLIILANFFLGIYTSLSVWYKLIDRTKVGAYISIVGAVVTLVLNYLLIPVYSYMGSAIATLAAYGTMMAISYFMGNKYYPIPYDKKRIIGYLSVSTLLAGLSFYVPSLHNYIFGVLAILIFGYFIYRNEKQTILRLIKR